MISLDILLIGLEAQIRYRRGCYTKLNHLNGILLLEPDMPCPENYLYVVSCKDLQSRYTSLPDHIWLLCSDAENLTEPYASFFPSCNNLILFDMHLSGLLNSLSIRFHQHEFWKKQLELSTDLAEMTQMASEASGYPIAIVDSFFQAKIASKTNGARSAVFRELDENHRIQSHIAFSLLSSERTNLPRDILELPSDNCVVTDYLIRYENKSIARILIERPDQPESPASAQYIEDYLNAVRPLVQAANEVEKLSMNSSSILVSDLINMRISDPEEVERRRMLTPDMIKGQFFHTIVIQFRTTSEQIPFHFISGQLSHIFHRSSVSFYENCLVIIAAKNDHDAELIYDRKQLMHILETYDGYVGIGGCSSNLSSLRPLYLQSSAAIRLGRIFGQNPRQRIFQFNDYRMYFYVDLCVEAAVSQHKILNISYLCAPGIFSIISHDRTHNKQLFDTLCTYLKCDCNSTICAEQMNVHRNTITYRIATVERILNGSLNDPIFRQSVFFSTLVIEYITKALNCDPLEAGGKFSLDVDWKKYRSILEQ